MALLMNLLTISNRFYVDSLDISADVIPSTNSKFDFFSEEYAFYFLFMLTCCD